MKIGNREAYRENTGRLSLLRKVGKYGNAIKTLRHEPACRQAGIHKVSHFNNLCFVNLGVLVPLWLKYNFS